MFDNAVKLWREHEPGRFRVEHPLVVNTKDGSVLVYVPAGEFEMGDGHDRDFPKHRVELSAYWIGVTAVTNAQYLKFIEATIRDRKLDNERYNQDKFADHPVTGVSWDDSIAYAKWAGCELASEAQWENACRGPLGHEYPWGGEWDEKRCRHEKNRGGETTCRGYDYPGGVSGYGTYDQSGNVWEWCADWFGEDYYRESPEKDPRGPARGSCRVLRGGGWRYDDPDFFRAANRYRYAPGFRYVSLGFRLVRPAS